MVPPSFHVRASQGRTALRAFVLCSLFWIVSAVYGNPVARAAGLRIAEGAPHASLWRRIYNRIPAVWKADRPLIVREISDDEMDALVERSGGNQRPEDASTVVDGCYLDGGEDEDDPASITLRETLIGANAGLVFAHEYGHYVWNNMLTDSQRAHYQRLWSTQKRSRHLVTGYAGYSDEEGFAEAFSFFVIRPEALHHRDSASWQYLLNALATRQKHGFPPPYAQRAP